MGVKQKYLLAVSGGIDSVVLLDKMIRDGHDATVAHFDHGVRDDSAADARFVGELAKKYGVQFVTVREELAGAGEDIFRKRRYAFLFAEAKKRSAILVTAHHSDDIIETIAINIHRGTGWRGLAVFDSKTVYRPLLKETKRSLYEYALKYRLEWVEDSTNSSTNYLRNRIRRQIAQYMTGDQKKELLSLRVRQVERKRAIDSELMRLMPADGVYDRYFFTYVDEVVACELLRAAITLKTSQSPLRPQLLRALVAIKTAKPESIFELGGGVNLVFTKRTFVVQTP